LPKTEIRERAAKSAFPLVKPVDNAIRILRYLSSSGRAFTLTRIARELGINSSTCFNILRTLTAAHMIELDAESKTYSTGVGVLDLAGGYLSQGGLLREAQLKMQNVAYQFEATTTLWRPVGENRQVLVSIIDSIADLRVHMRIGQRLPLLIGAVGRVLAGFGHLDDSELRRQFAELRWQAPLSFRDYKTQTVEGLERGWTIDRSNHVKGVVTIAAPVLGTARNVSLVLAASMFDVQQKTVIRRLASSVVATAGDIADYINHPR
jgi:DNA-binding IclR family transcriptional regulator